MFSSVRLQSERPAFQLRFSKLTLRMRTTSTGEASVRTERVSLGDVHLVLETQRRYRDKGRDVTSASCLCPGIDPVSHRLVIGDLRGGGRHLLDTNCMSSSGDQNPPNRTGDDLTDRTFGRGRLGLRPVLFEPTFIFPPYSVLIQFTGLYVQRENL